ncbi:hypothetical protein [Novilysobacter spongiicola]|uniref:Uncharacterized protein n=1 Tax=Lysobacter spongiicola DSM 21749 TaxID=1122188 RepID=A0A1T4Q7U5_9GAMM|nr:hypothetical protein [Lysobacter spongiicola]SJZ99832.1 hypothetical protein SAMN02745674_01539 [Lysobacter spongiicola DSM 21749]
MTGRSAGPEPNRPRPAPVPPALAAFLRGVERRGAVLAELQCGDASTGDAALAAAMARFRDEAARMPMGDWPSRFWAMLLAQPGLRGHTAVAMELEASDRLAELGSGPRAALLLRLAAGLEEAEAASVLGVALPSYRLALHRALPRHPDGSADPDAWQRLRREIHRRIKTLPPDRLARLGRIRERALEGGTRATPAEAAEVAPRRSRSFIVRLLWALLILCALLFAATFSDRFADWAGLGPDLSGPPSELDASRPASRYSEEAGLVAHRDFELLAEPAAMEEAEQLAFRSWLAAGGLESPPAAQLEEDE